MDTLYDEVPKFLQRFVFLWTKTKPDTKASIVEKAIDIFEQRFASWNDKIRHREIHRMNQMNSPLFNNTMYNFMLFWTRNAGYSIEGHQRRTLPPRDAIPTYVPDWFWLSNTKWNALTAKDKQAWKQARKNHIADILRSPGNQDTKNFIKEYLDTVAHLTGEVENQAFESLKDKYKGKPLIWQRAFSVNPYLVKIDKT